MMRFCLAFLALAPGVRGQAVDWTDDDATIAAHCKSSDDAGAPAGPTVTQASGTSFDVASEGSPDAVYLRDQYGTTLALQSTGTLNNLQGVQVGSSNPDAVTAFVHYPSPNCWTVQSAVPTQTWSSKVTDYLASDEASYGFAGTDGPNSAQLLASTPTITVDYASRTATVEFTRQPNMVLPYLYVKGMEGVVLKLEQFGFYNFTSGKWECDPDAEDEEHRCPSPATATSATTTVTIPDYTTSLAACTWSCADYIPTGDEQSLIDQIAADIESTVSEGTALVVTPTFQDEVITLPVDCTASTYVSYAKDANGNVIAMARDRALTFQISSTATTLEFSQLCSNELRKADVSLTSLRTAYASNVANTVANADPDAQTVPLSCTLNGVTHAMNDVWQDDHGEPCSCTDGNVVCGAGTSHPIYFTGGEVAGISIGCFVLFSIIVAAGYIQYMKTQARKVVEGRRKSFDGNEYRTSNAAGAQPGQVEIELPTPQGVATAPAP